MKIIIKQTVNSYFLKCIHDFNQLEQKKYSVFMNFRIILFFMNFLSFYSCWRFLFIKKFNLKFSLELNFSCWKIPRSLHCFSIAQIFLMKKFSFLPLRHKNILSQFRILISQFFAFLNWHRCNLFERNFHKLHWRQLYLLFFF